MKETGLNSYSADQNMENTPNLIRDTCFYFFLNYCHCNVTALACTSSLNTIIYRFSFFLLGNNNLIRHHTRIQMYLKNLWEFLLQYPEKMLFKISVFSALLLKPFKNSGLSSKNASFQFQKTFYISNFTPGIL